MSDLDNITPAEEEVQAQNPVEETKKKPTLFQGVKDRFTGEHGNRKRQERNQVHIVSAFGEEHAHLGLDHKELDRIKRVHLGREDGQSVGVRTVVLQQAAAMGVQAALKKGVPEGGFTQKDIEAITKQVMESELAQDLVIGSKVKTRGLVRDVAVKGSGAVLATGIGGVSGALAGLALCPLSIITKPIGWCVDKVAGTDLCSKLGPTGFIGGGAVAGAAVLGGPKALKAVKETWNGQTKNSDIEKYIAACVAKGIEKASHHAVEHGNPNVVEVKAPAVEKAKGEAPAVQSVAEAKPEPAVVETKTQAQAQPVVEAEKPQVVAQTAGSNTIDIKSMSMQEIQKLSSEAKGLNMTAILSRAVNPASEPVVAESAQTNKLDVAKMSVEQIQALSHENKAENMGAIMAKFDDVNKAALKNVTFEENVPVSETKVSGLVLAADKGKLTEAAQDMPTIKPVEKGTPNLSVLQGGRLDVSEVTQAQVSAANVPDIRVRELGGLSA